MMDKDDYEQDRAVASCLSMWDNRNESKESNRMDEERVEAYLEGEVDTVFEATMFSEVLDKVKEAVEALGWDVERSMRPPGRSGAGPSGKPLDKIHKVLVNVDGETVDFAVLKERMRYYIKPPHYSGNMSNANTIGTEQEGVDWDGLLNEVQAVVNQAVKDKS
jgi:hypothetical protein